MDTVYVIRWRRDLSASYNYGSQIQFQNSEVQFSNTIMSPGEKIHSWASTSVYKNTRWVPELPLLFAGQEYSFNFHFEAEPVDSVHIGIAFLDNRGEEIDNLVFTELAGTFTFPEEARGYEISLLNMSNTQLNFSYFTLGLTSIVERLKYASVDGLIDVHTFVSASEVNADKWHVKLVDSSTTALTSNMYYGSDRQSEIVIGIPINQLNNTANVPQLAQKTMGETESLLKTGISSCTLEIDDVINQHAPQFVSGVQQAIHEMGGNK